MTASRPDAATSARAGDEVVPASPSPAHADDCPTVLAAPWDETRPTWVLQTPECNPGVMRRRRGP